MSYVQYQLPFELTDSSYAWYNPFSSSSPTHWGYDFNQHAPGGANIKACADGVVSKAPSTGASDAHGYRIEIKHADGKYTGYCHMQAPSTLNVGDTVSRGDVLGKVGNSGYISGVSIGTHLHLSMATAIGDSIAGAGTCQDPIQWILDHDTPGGDVPTLFSRDYSTSQTLATSSTWAGSSLLVAAGTYGIGAADDKELINASVTVSVDAISTGDWAIARFIRYNVSAGTIAEAFEQVVWSGSTIGDSYQISVNAYVPVGQSLRLQVRSNLSSAHAVDVQTRALIWEL